MLIGGVVEDHLDDYTELAFVSGSKKILEVLQCAVQRMHGPVVGNIVTIIPQRRREERHQPDRVDA